MADFSLIDTGLLAGIFMKIGGIEQAVKQVKAGMVHLKNRVTNLERKAWTGLKID